MDSDPARGPVARRLGVASRLTAAEDATREVAAQLRAAGLAPEVIEALMAGGRALLAPARRAATEMVVSLAGEPGWVVHVRDDDGQAVLWAQRVFPGDSPVPRPRDPEAARPPHVAAEPAQLLRRPDGRAGS